MKRNRQVANLLELIADLMEVAGQSARRAGAYRRGARTVARLAEPVEEVVSEGRLQELPGIGPTLAARITELVETGTSPLLAELQAQVSPGMLAVLQVPGIGPRTAHLLFSRLGVTDLDSLEAALAAGEVRQLPGMGPRSEARLQEELAAFRRRQEKIPVGIALPAAQTLVQWLSRLPGVQQAAYVGPLRRGKELVAKIPLLAAMTPEASLKNLVVALEAEEAVGDIVAAHVSEEAGGPFHSAAEVPALTFSFAVQHGLALPVELHLTPPAAWTTALWYWTGSSDHRRQLQQLAAAAGLQLTAAGLHPVQAEDGPPQALPSEAHLYSRLQLPYIAPELRTGEGEVEAAQKDQLPDLITLADIKGDLHCHSQWSDGRETIAAMVAAAQERDYEFLAITDHSQALTVAGGLKPAEVAAQREEIEALRQQLPDFTLLHGIEVDILADGSLDLPDELLARLDVVIAAVHSRFQQDAATMTARIVKAMENPHVDIIAHPTGRLLGQRDPYAVDMEALLQAAADTGTVLEINAAPERLDLSSFWARQGKRRGVLISINSDAHSRAGFDVLAYGITTARRAWLEADDVINCWPAQRLSAWLRQPKDKRQ